MKKKDRQELLIQTGKVLAVIISVALCVCQFPGIWRRQGDSLTRLWTGEIAERAMEIIMPAFSYGSAMNHEGISSDAEIKRARPGQKLWPMLAEAAMAFWPVGTYTAAQVQADTEAEDAQMYAFILEQQEQDENAVDENGQLITADKQIPETVQEAVPKTAVDREKLKDYEYLMSHFYTVDSSTMADPDLISAEKLLGKSMKITMDGTPKVLIYHTHSQEMFADSVSGDPGTSIVGMGTYLTELLNQRYGIQTLHHEGVYDLVNGKLDRSKAYQLAEPEVQKILKENPGIEVVIDLHRDGVADTTHLVTEIDGKQTAQIMFFNGLSRTRANGNISYLANPYLEDNLAFSLQMEIAAAEYYPGFARNIFLRAYRYNMHFRPKTLLIEAGAQTNTVEEMRNAMELLADLLHRVLA